MSTKMLHQTEARADPSHPVLTHQVSAIDCDAAGAVRAAVLLDLAERAVQQALSLDGTVTQFQTIFGGPVEADILRVRPRLRHECGSGVSVEVEFLDPDGVSLCAIALRVAVHPASPPDRAHAPNPARSLKTVKNPVREQRAEKLIAAATRVIGEKGFAGATIRDIARAAEIHVPTVYDYFNSKEALLVAIYRREMEHALEALTEGTDGSGSAADRLFRLLSNQLSFAVANRQSVALLNREFRHLSTEARQDMTALYGQLLVPYEKIIAEGIATGEFRDVDPFVAANFMESAGDILVLRPFFFKGRQLESFLDSLRQLLIDGLVAR